MSDLEVCLHEAGHCVAGLLLGIPIVLVDTVGNETRRGWIEHRHRFTDAKSARKHAIMILAGPIVSEDDGPREWGWPLSDDASKDEQQVKRIVEALRFTENDWRDLLIEAAYFVTSSPFDILLRATCGILDTTPRIGREHLEPLARIARSFEENR